MFTFYGPREQSFIKLERQSAAALVASYGMQIVTYNLNDPALKAFRHEYKAAGGEHSSLHITKGVRRQVALRTPIGIEEFQADEAVDELIYTDSPAHNIILAKGHDKTVMFAGALFHSQSSDISALLSNSDIPVFVFGSQLANNDYYAGLESRNTHDPKSTVRRIINSFELDVRLLQLHDSSLASPTDQV